MPERLKLALMAYLFDSSISVVSFEWGINGNGSLNIKFFDSGMNYFDRDFYLNSQGQAISRENAI